MKRTPLKIPSHQQIMGGAHGNLSAKWQRMAPNIWCLVPDPGLKLAVRKDYGPYLGEVAYDAARGICTLEVRSRHGRRWSFTGPARTAADARQALCDKIAAATANPAWVSGFDDRYGPGQPADDMTPWSGGQRDPYPFEWCDRMAVAINGFRSVAQGTPRTLRGKHQALEMSARAGLAERCNQLQGLFAAGRIARGTREGRRAYDLLNWGRLLLVSGVIGSKRAA